MRVNLNKNFLIRRDPCYFYVFKIIIVNLKNWDLRSFELNRSICFSFIWVSNTFNCCLQPIGAIWWSFQIGCYFCSMDSLVPSILHLKHPWVPIPSTSARLIWLILQFLIKLWQWVKNKWKIAKDGQYLKSCLWY